jgi:uncharacterized protein
MKSDYATVAARIRPEAWKLQTKYLLLIIPDSLALMLLGVALFKWGFLTGSWSRAAYWKTALIGYGIGLPLVIYSTYYGVIHTPNLEASLRYMAEVPVPWVSLCYPFQRIFLVMAHIAVLILICKSGVVRGFIHSLERVGQMAFTNYILHSVICTLFFFGYGFNRFAELQYYQIYLVVAAIWILQLVASPLWLRYFCFGPLEWLWRCLTYWHVQPMKRKIPPGMVTY